MSTDRELLELAAKALGCTLKASSLYPDTYAIRQHCDGASISLKWNPLTDDGDALRLAVKLGLTIEQFADDGSVVVTHGVSVRASESYDATYASRDPYAATRRAIVRAAAEIGKTL